MNGSDGVGVSNASTLGNEIRCWSSAVCRASFIAVAIEPLLLVVSILVLLVLMAHE